MKPLTLLNKTNSIIHTILTFRTSASRTSRSVVTNINFTLVLVRYPYLQKQHHCTLKKKIIHKILILQKKKKTLTLCNFQWDKEDPEMSHWELVQIFSDCSLKLKNNNKKKMANLIDYTIGKKRPPGSDPRSETGLWEMGLPRSSTTSREQCTMWWSLRASSASVKLCMYRGLFCRN